MSERHRQVEENSSGVWAEFICTVDVLSVKLDYKV